MSRGSALNFCSETCLQPSISQENAATKSVTSFSFNWLFCSWELRTLGGGENSSWGYVSTGLGYYCCSWVLTLAQDPLLSVPSFAGPEEFIPLAKKSKLLTVLVIYSFILWTWSGVTIKGDEGIEIHPSSRPQGHENHKWLCYTKGTTWQERRWALFSLNRVHSGTLSNVLIRPVSTCTHFENQCTGQTRNVFL